MYKFILIMTLAVLSCVVRAEQTVERIAHSPRLRNQGQTSTCWLHSSFQMIEQMAGTSLAIDALLIPEIKSRALIRFLGGETPWDGGAGPTRPFALALEHGLVPEGVWNKDSVIIANYGTIFSRIELLLTKWPGPHGQEGVDDFLRRVDDIITDYTGDLPPKDFEWNGRHWSAREYAAKVIGHGPSIGWDFRDVKYDPARYGMMPELAWTTILAANGRDLVRIADVIRKVVNRVSADEAFDKAVQIFSEGRPVAFTFIWWDHLGRTVLSLNSKHEYVAVLPSTEGTYMSSHLVHITGVIREKGKAVALEALDPTQSSLTKGFRVITHKFFETHGKTVHEIGPCEAILSAPSRP